MPFTKSVCSAIANNQVLAFFSSDSVLHVWDVTTGELKQQFLPSSHLTAAFTCLSWKINAINKKKRKKSDQIQQKENEHSNEYITLGTAVGEIVLYNVLNGELVLKYTAGHNEQVNCISWTNHNTFYSCSSDQHIIEWDVNSEKYISKWKGGVRDVQSICVGPHSKTLLAAGKLIKLWDLKTKKVLQKFSGHASPILAIYYLTLPSALADDNDSNKNDGLYFLSAATEDRTMSAWQVGSRSSKNKVATCSFALLSEPTFLDVIPSDVSGRPVWVLAATEDEQILLFSHTLNGFLDKPFESCKTIRVVTLDAQPLKLISASFNKLRFKTDNLVSVIVAYGSSLRVVFETVNIEEHSGPDIVLIRNDPSKSDIYLEQDKLKIREPNKSKALTSVVPGIVEHSGKVASNKRKMPASLAEEEVGEKESLENQNFDVSTSKALPKADSYAILLSQGLQSKDSDILNQVLQHGSDSLIRNTVSQLKINYVIPLIKELTKRLKGNPNKCLIYSKWMKSTLSNHTSFLTTLPAIIPLLNEVYRIIEIRKQIHERLPVMQGKLEMLLSQVDSKKEDDSLFQSSANDALYVYDEDSADDIEEMDDITEDPTQEEISTELYPDSESDWNMASSDEDFTLAAA